MSYDNIVSLLGSEAENLLQYESKTISKDLIHAPGPDFVDRIFAQSNRNPQVLRSLQQLFDHGRLVRNERVLIHGGAGGVGAYAVPSLHLASWNFTGNAQG